MTKKKRVPKGTPSDIKIQPVLSFRKIILCVGPSDTRAPYAVEKAALLAFKKNSNERCSISRRNEFKTPKDFITAKQIDIVLVAGEYPTPVGTGQKIKMNRVRKIARRVDKANILMYYIGDPHTKAFRTAKTLGETLAHNAPYHINNRHGSKEMRRVYKQGLRVLIVGNKSDNAELKRESRLFFKQMLKSFLDTTKPKREYYPEQLKKDDVPW